MSILAGAAATIGESLGKDIGDYIRHLTRFSPEADSQYHRLWAECEKLARSDAVRAMAYKAILCISTGSYDDALYYVRNIALNRSPLHAPTLASVLINFGRFSESLEAYRQMMAPDMLTPDYFHLGVPNGAYRSYVEALDFVRTKMQLATVFPEAEADIRAAAAILEENGESEDHIASAMDVAGEVMRERSLVFYGLHHTLRPVQHPRDGGPAYFGVNIGVEVDDETAFEMTCEYAERLSASDKFIPVSMVLKFVSLGERNGQ
ncbi:hypothetical protein [Achromobacter sp. UBA2119]|uniref:hypothetical protein n=1 Tax=Achromobacter sp. UBA2119 TaxID=1945911 RepID=UPI00257A546B|nr:hypothetical protein [Achromobacter sp. UBA2119]